MKKFCIALIIFIVFILLLSGLYLAYKYQNQEKDNIPKDVQTLVKMSINDINQALEDERQLENKTLNDIKTAKNFADILAKRLKTTATQNFTHTGIVSVEFSKNEIKKYNLEELTKMPAIHTISGFIYYIVKFEEGCKSVDLKEPYKSSCIIMVDINGINKPNHYGSKTEEADRYILIADGKNNTIKLKQTVTK